MAAPLSSLRLLILSPPPRLPYSPSPFPSILHALSGTHPTQDQAASGFAGYTQHPPLSLRTKYYDADVGIWCDEVPLPLTVGNNPAEQQNAQASDGATEVPAPPGQSAQIEGQNRDLDVLGGGGASPTAGADSVDADIDANAPSSLSTWRATMLSEPAREVREAIGGILLALPLPLTFPSHTSASPLKRGPSHDYLETVEAVNDLRELIEEESYGREVPAMVLIMATGKGVGESDLDATTEKLEAVMLEERGLLGWDFVGWDGEVSEDGVTAGGPKGLKNAYGERIGIDRVRELLEAVDWSAPGGGLKRDDLDLGFLSSDEECGAPGLDGIKRQGQELEREMMGLKLAMMNQEPGDEEDDEEEERYVPSQDTEGEDVMIDQLPQLLERVVAIREAGAEMSKADRERFAKREVERIMKDLT
jgi:hypothetical protein